MEVELQQYEAEIAELKNQLTLKQKQLASQTMSGEEARALRAKKVEVDFFMRLCILTCLLIKTHFGIVASTHLSACPFS